MKLRNVCFTINNPTEDDIELLHNGFEDGFFNYVLCGLEKGEKKGTPHLQGYAEMPEQNRLKAIRSYMPRAAKIQERKGTQSIASNYCKKGEMLKSEWNRLGPDGQKLREKGLDFGKNYIEVLDIGKPKKQGSRGDLENIQEELLAGVPLHEVIWRCKNYQQAKFAELLYAQPQVKKPVRNWMTEAYIYWGVANAGKTHKCMEEAEAYAKLNNYRVWHTSMNLQWWTGYNGQEVIIMDDFDDSKCALGMLLDLIDKKAMKVNPKGTAEVELLAKRVYITSNFSPFEWYSGTTENRRYALQSRFTRDFEFTQQLPKEIGRKGSISMKYEDWKIDPQNDVEQLKWKEITEFSNEIHEIDETKNVSENVSEVGRVIMVPAETKTEAFNKFLKNLERNNEYFEQLYISCKDCYKEQRNFARNCTKHNPTCDCGAEKELKYRVHNEDLEETKIYYDFCEECDIEAKYDKNYKDWSN